MLNGFGILSFLNFMVTSTLAAILLTVSVQSLILFWVLSAVFAPYKNLPPLHPKSLNMREFATVTVGGADVFLSRRLRCVLISAACNQDVF